MQRSLCLALAPACGLALSAKPHGHFMALAQTSEACSPDAYTGPADYGDLCARIDADCKAAADKLKAGHDSNLRALEEECARQKRILAGKEDTHADEKAERKEEDMDVAEAKQAVADKAHCRPQLYAAREDLNKEEAIPNDSSEDIDNECKAKKRVMEAEECVRILEKAEAVLDKQKAQHAEESAEEDKAASALPPQEERVRIACQAFEDASNKPAPTLGDCGKNRKDDLLKQADQYIEDLLAEYLRQKKILEGKQDVHADEKEDVDAQEKVVSAERKDVVQAKADVEQYDHCPPELVKAKAELAKQEGIPNDTPFDIDAECEAKKAVLEAEKCVEKLRKAEAILSTQKDEHSEEKSDLSTENSQEDRAAAALPPQEKIVCDLKAALDAARAARESLPCDKPKPAPAPAPAPEPEPEPEKKKSGAARAATATAIFAVLLGAMVQA